MWNSRFHGVCRIVYFLHPYSHQSACEFFGRKSQTNLQLLEVSRLVIHLDFECVNLQQLSTTLRLVIAVSANSGVMKITNELGGMFITYSGITGAGHIPLLTGHILSGRAKASLASSLFSQIVSDKDISASPQMNPPPSTHLILGLY